jgi:hypothetical protein
MRIGGGGAGGCVPSYEQGGQAEESRPFFGGSARCEAKIAGGGQFGGSRRRGWLAGWLGWRASGLFLVCDCRGSTRRTDTTQIASEDQGAALETGDRGRIRVAKYVQYVCTSIQDDCSKQLHQRLLYGEIR